MTWCCFNINTYICICVCVIDSIYYWLHLVEVQFLEIRTNLNWSTEMKQMSSPYFIFQIDMQSIFLVCKHVPSRFSCSFIFPKVVVWRESTKIHEPTQYQWIEISPLSGIGAEWHRMLNIDSYCDFLVFLWFKQVWFL